MKHTVDRSTDNPNSVRLASNWEVAIWSTNAITTKLFTTYYLYISQVFNTAFELNAGLIGIVSVFPAILGTISNPLIGSISDNTHSRWGRRRPYIFAGALLTGISLAAIWWASPSWSPYLLILWLAIGLIAFDLATSVLNVPTEALGYELTDDYNQRTKIQSVKFFLGSLAGLGTPWLYWLALRPFWGGEIAGFRSMGLIVGLLIIVIGILPAIFCRERFAQSNQKPERLWKQLGDSLKNKYFRDIIYIRLSSILSSTLFTGLNFYINVFYICQGNKSFATMLNGLNGTVYSVLSLAFLLVIPWLGRTLGKRNCLVIGNFLGLLLALIQPLIQTPHHPYLQFVGTALAVPSGLMVNIFSSSFMPDICDIGEVRSRRRMEGVYSSVFAFLANAEGTLVAVIVGFLINFSGFDPHQTAQKIATLNNLRWLAYGPYILFSILALWLTFRFKVDEKMMTKVRGILLKRRDRGDEETLAPRVG